MNKIIYLLIGLVVLYILIGLFLPKSFDCEVINFNIEQGEHLEQIAINLKDQGIIRSKNFLSAYVFIIGKANQVKSGHYQIKKCENIVQIGNKIISSQFPDKKFTIIPGWTNKKIAKELVNIGFIEKEEDFRAEEGYIFPDTYFLNNADTLEDLVKKARDNFNSKVGKIDYDDLILASIIEKELQTLEDKKTGTGVLLNRLNTGMALQVDASLTYILGKASAELSKQDLELDSPYNTYKYSGLPPTPICNPSLESIEAVLNPIGTDYWYYLSTPEGETIFSKTLEEHRQAKWEHLK